MTHLDFWKRLKQWKALAALTLASAAFFLAWNHPAEARRHYFGHRHHYGHAANHHGWRHHAVRHARFRGGHRHAHASGGEGPVTSSGIAAIVVDANSGRAIYARNEHELRHPASVTKVMTLYLLFEQLEKGRVRLNSPLVISSHAASQAPSKLGLAPGETISVENAIKAVVTKSANDIAVAIAENIGGDEDSFAHLMTEKAHALGMRRTHFANASGLPDPEQITTAYDLALLGRAIQDRFPSYYRYFSTHVFAYNGAQHRNHNHLLGRVEGMDGIKTGYTRASGFNLLTSVRRGGRHIVAVVLGGSTAGARDRLMANLIEGHIAESAPMRTARAITDDETVVRPTEQAEEPVLVAHRDVPTRDIASQDDEEDGPIPSSAVRAPSPRAPARVAVPAPVSPAPVIERAEKARPAFVSGVQKRVEVAVEHKSHAAKSKVAVIVDGSTSRAATRGGRAEISAVSTTPSALKRSDAGSSQAAKADPHRPQKPGWMIQVGATDDPGKANELLSRARTQLHGFPTTARPFTEKVQKGKDTLFRARFAGLEEHSAETACKALKRSGFSCFATKN